MPNPHGLNAARKLLFFVQRLNTKLRRLLWRWKNLLPITSDQSPMPQYQTTFAPESDLYYFHFEGLANMWNLRSKKSAEIYNEDIHFEDQLIAKLARESKLLDS